MHCGGTVEPWKRTHVHQPRDFISHWKSTANAARGGGQSLVRCVRMWNAKCERAAQPEQQQAQAALRCSAVRSAALQLVVSTPTSSPVEVPAPHHHHKANCRKLPAAMIQLNCLHCAGVRESERERKSDAWEAVSWRVRACVREWEGLCVSVGSVVWFYFHCQLLYTPVSMQYAHTRIFTYICIGRIDSTSILGLIDSSVQCASAYLAPSWK